MSKLQDFLKKEKLDTRRLLAVSKAIENHQREDRAVRLARRQVKSGKPSDADKALAEKKARSNRPVSPAMLTRALDGKAISRHARKRIARAVNHLLTQKKKKETTVGDLFGK